MAIQYIRQYASIWIHSKRDFDQIRTQLSSLQTREKKVENNRIICVELFTFYITFDFIQVNTASKIDSLKFCGWLKNWGKNILYFQEKIFKFKCFFFSFITRVSKNKKFLFLSGCYIYPTKYKADNTTWLQRLGTLILLQILSTPWGGLSSLNKTHPRPFSYIFRKNSIWISTYSISMY